MDNGFHCSTKHLCSIGSTAESVFPEPVGATIILSPPSHNSGRVETWTGVGFQPFECSAAANFARRCCYVSAREFMKLHMSFQQLVAIILPSTVLSMNPTQDRGSPLAPETRSDWRNMSELPYCGQSEEGSGRAPCSMLDTVEGELVGRFS